MSKTLAEGLSDFYAQQAHVGPANRAISGRAGPRVQRGRALAVHPDQRQEAMADAEAKGVPTYFDAQGRPEFGGGTMSRREHRKRYMKAYGYFDRDAGYGDAAPNHGKRPKLSMAEVNEIAEALGLR